MSYFWFWKEKGFLQNNSVFHTPMFILRINNLKLFTWILLNAFSSFIQFSPSTCKKINIISTQKTPIWKN